jgi:hypothetical protein
MPPGINVRVQALLSTLSLASHADLNKYFLERDAFLTPWTTYRDECLLALKCMEDAQNPHLTKWVETKTIACLQSGVVVKIKGTEDEPIKCRLYTVRFLFDLINNLTKPGEYYHSKADVPEYLVSTLYQLTKQLCSHYRQKVLPVIHVIERLRPSTVEDYESHLRERDERDDKKKKTLSRFEKAVGAENVLDAGRLKQRAETGAAIRKAGESSAQGPAKSKCSASSPASTFKVSRVTHTLKTAAERDAAITFSVDGEELEALKPRPEKDDTLYYPKFGDEYGDYTSKVMKAKEKGEKDEESGSDEESLFIKDRRKNRIPSPESEPWASDDGYF